MTRSLLGRWDARCRLIGLVGFALATAGTRALPAAVLAAVISGVLILTAGVTLRGIALRIGFILLGVVPFAIGLAVSQPEPFATIAALVLRSIAIGMTGFALWEAGPSAEIVTAAAQLRLPMPLVLVARLAERYSGLFFAEFRRSYRSARARGFAGRSVRVYGHLMGGVLARGLLRGESVSRAMAARGFDGTARKGPPFSVRMYDIFVLTVIGILALAVAVLDHFG